MEAVGTRGEVAAKRNERTIKLNPPFFHTQLNTLLAVIQRSPAVKQLAYPPATSKEKLARRRVFKAMVAEPINVVLEGKECTSSLAKQVVTIVTALAYLHRTQSLALHGMGGLQGKFESKEEAVYEAAGGELHPIEVPTGWGVGG